MRGAGENGDCNLGIYRNSGNRRYRVILSLCVKVCFDMKNLKRFIFGALSSLLFAVGFARAADHFDPMSRSLPQTNNDSSIAGAPDCTSICDVNDDKL